MNLKSFSDYKFFARGCQFYCLFFALILLIQPALAGDLASEAMAAQEKIFERDYPTALQMFKTLEQNYPNHPIGPFGQMALWEMRELENENFAYEKEYQAAADKAIALMDRLPAVQTNLSEWDLFVLSSGYGLQGFHHARKSEWWRAYIDGNKARHYLKKLIWAHPEFYDASMGLGMYDYYRSVFTARLRFLPFFPDKRESGIAQVKITIEKGTYANRLGVANLALIYLNERRYVEAQTLLEDLLQRYPRNTILRMFLGKAYFFEGQYAKALAAFQTVEKIDPTLTKAHTYAADAKQHLMKR